MCHNLNEHGLMKNLKMSEETYPEKNKTVTFRINAQVLGKMKAHAKSEKITLNLLVNQLLEHAVE